MELTNNKEMDLAKIKSFAIEGSINAVLFADFEGKVCYVNPSFLNLWGYEKESEVLNRSIFEFLSDQDEVKRISTSVSVAGSWIGEQVAIKKDGSPFYVQISSCVLTSVGGEPMCVMSSFVDITELKNAEKQLIQSVKLASIGELAASIAHEVNNPLTIIHGYIDVFREILELNDLLNEEATEAISAQEASVARITAIVNGLRMFSRSEEKVEVFDIHHVISESISMLKKMYNKVNVHFVTALHKEPLFVSGKRGHFQQVLVNLFSNAKDALEESAKGVITVNTSILNNKVTIQVTDNGCGIAPENLPKIFETFYTSKPRGKGTGLGMSISAKIIKEMEGVIEVTSKLGKGTNFTLFFPQVEGENKKGKAPSKVRYKKLKGRILLVDDEPDIVKVASRYLRKFGLEVEVAFTGEEALTHVTAENFHVLMTDYKMPGMNGDELIQAVKKGDGEIKHFILITGDIANQTDSDQFSHIRPYVHTFLTKPFTKEKLYSTLSQILDKT